MQLRRARRFRGRRQAQPTEQGMALLMAVLIGVVLIGAASALLAVQLLVRRSGSSASNRDLAEAAALNGLSRIEAQLNQSNGGYLWEVPSTAWADAIHANGSTIRPLLSQPCSFSPIDAAALTVLQGGTIGAERTDAGGTISNRYALRSYARSGGNWLLTVEGIAARQSGNGVVVARSLISRRFEVNPGVASTGRWDDWAVLAGREMELGSSQILNSAGSGSGPGTVQLLLEDTTANRNGFASGSDCDSSALLARVGSTSANLQGRLLPTLGQTMPGAGWFDINNDNIVVDKNTTNGSERYWQCDDSQALPCNFSDATTSGNTIRLPQSKICAGNSTNRPCQVWIQKLKLRSKTLMIETQTRPVVLKLSTYNSFIDLAGTGKLCSVNVSQSTCLATPERLVILGSAADTASSCSDTSSLDQSYVSIAGNSLPAALVVLPDATFRLSGPASLRGLVWAKRICASAGLSLLTQVNADPVIQRASTTWAFPKATSAGRSLIRASSTSTDPFQPWP